MPVPSEVDLVNVWTLAQSMPQVARAVALLQASSPDESLDALARLPIGRRDAWLLAVRAEWFGRELPMTASCPACGVRVEFQAPLAAITTARAASEGTVAVSSGDYVVEARLPDTFDLLAAARESDAASARTLLVRRCVVEARHGAESIDVAQLPESVIGDLAQTMNRNDPVSDITFSLTCPDCAHPWECIFDIASFLWSEVDAAAIRALRDVHALAAAYGWREAEVLAIPPERRQVYLAMVTA